MHAETYEKVRQNPLFHELIKRRSRLAITLSAIVLGAYYSFIMAVAFAPDLLRTPLGDDTPVTWGIPLGAILVVIAWGLTGLYSHFANGRFEDLTNQLLREIAE